MYNEALNFPNHFNFGLNAHSSPNAIAFGDDTTWKSNDNPQLTYTVPMSKAL